MSGQSVYFVVDGTGQVDDGMLSTILNFETYHVFGQGRADDFIALGAGNDSGEGFGGNDSLYGGAGSDRLSGGSGDDGLDGGADSDTLAGGSGNDLVSGDDGNDRLRGSGGSDTLYGGAGADVLNGGAGDDWLSGGDGADRFVFTAGDGGGDLIVDFVSGTDALRFAADLLAGAPGWTGRATAADFAIGSATAAHGQFVLSHVSFANVTELAWDADGTAGSTPLQTLVTLNGIVTVAAEDIWIL
jgi:Ca2+-binding RTX toxin-like protein